MKTLLSLFQLLPAILQAILGLQQTGIAGLSKKQIILHVIDVAAQLGEQIPVALVQAISLLIDKIVTTLETEPVVVPPMAPIVPPAPAVMGS